jgi:uridine kinase
MYPQISLLASQIAAVGAAAGRKAVLAGVSGIDASGKGYISAALASELTARGIRVALIGVDGWLNLPGVRFDPRRPAETFYERALRLDEMFAGLVLPLCRDGSIRLTADLVDETAHEYHREEYAFDNMDVVLVEGIFIFKKEFVAHFDHRIWIECPFATALERAVCRSQEGLPPADTIHAYETIYFPAQRIHFGSDRPCDSADVIVPNW